MPPWLDIILQSLTLTFMLVGLFGMIIPIFPGIMVIWISAAIYAGAAFFAGTMSGWDWAIFALITILMIIGSFVDNIIITAKLRETGTPWGSIAIGYTVGIISSLFLTPFAALLFTPLALYAAEYHRLLDRRLAFDSTKAWMIGYGWSFAALFAIGAVMIGLWMLMAWVV